MIHENFVIVGAIFNLAGGFSYLMGTLRGRTQPNRVSWFLWALAPGIAFAAQISQGVGLSALMTFMVGFSPAVIFLASFVNKKAVWKLGVFDYFCGLMALLAIVLWQVTKEGNIAIMFGIFADFFAAVPTIKKSFQHPESENYRIFLCGIISAAITLLAIRQWTFEYYGFAAFILCQNVLLTSLILRPKARTFLLKIRS